MKLLRYGPAGQEKPGLLDSNNQIRDLSGIVPDIAREALLPDALDRLRKLDPATLPVVKGTPRIGPCVGQVGKFICVGLNYSDHAAESGMAVPDEPILFMKATSSIVGPNDDILLPRGSQKTDWEVELGVVIGKPGEVRHRSRCPRRTSPATASSTTSRSARISSKARGSGSRARAPTRSVRSGPGS